MRSLLSALLVAFVLGCASPHEKMHRACQEGDVEAVEKLIAKDPALAMRKGEGVPPLHETKSRRVAELLLKAGAPLGEQDSTGAKAIHVAMSADVVDLFVERGADVREGYGPNVRTALHTARSASGLEAILRHGLPAQVRDRNGQTALFAQAEVESPETPAILRALVTAGLDVNARDPSGFTPLYVASASGVATLVALGANLEATLPRSGETPLHRAAFKNAAARVEALLKAGANPNARLPANAILELPSAPGIGSSVANATPLRLASDPKIRETLKKAGGTE